jgi:hypothetical protein
MVSNPPEGTLIEWAISTNIRRSVRCNNPIHIRRIQRPAGSRERTFDHMVAG